MIHWMNFRNPMITKIITMMTIRIRPKNTLRITNEYKYLIFKCLYISIKILNLNYNILIIRNINIWNIFE